MLRRIGTKKIDILSRVKNKTIFFLTEGKRDSSRTKNIECWECALDFLFDFLYIVLHGKYSPLIPLITVVCLQTYFVIQIWFFEIVHALKIMSNFMIRFMCGGYICILGATSTECMLTLHFFVIHKRITVIEFFKRSSTLCFIAFAC